MTSRFRVSPVRTILLTLFLLCPFAWASLEASAADAPTNSISSLEPVPLPIGLDAYRQWARWPYQRIGMRAYMRSTYDRRGGNEGADGSHFLYQLADDDNVTLNVAGPGVLCFVRYNHWHGSPWHFVVDGTDHLIQESSTADPAHPIPDSTFLPANLFPPPLGLTWSVTKGADLSWVPIPFEKSFRMGYSRTHYGTGYYIYDQFVPGMPLSQPLRAWDGQTPPDRDVLDLINRAGTDIAPADLTAITNDVQLLQPKGTNVIFNLTNVPPSLVRKLTFCISRNQAVAFGHARLRITWDDRSDPAVDAPVDLFFGAGTLYNRDNRRYLVKAFPSYIRFDETNVELACFFPMPFFQSANVELIGASDENLSNVVCSIGFESSNGSPGQVGYFHATYRDQGNPVPGHDLVLLDTRETEGGGDWSGSFIGTSFIFSDRANLTTLEGDPRFFFDDSQTPQAYGTGTEEWGGGGDYWGGQNMTLPFAGHPTGARKAASAVNDEDKIESAYRFLLADLMPFGKNARIQLEHGGTDNSTEHYQTVAYWYGAPEAALLKTDVLKIGDAASEKVHDYLSPQASGPYSITSRYEWGVDTIDGHEVFPATTDYGRKTTGASEFTLKIVPGNRGVMLRRKLDYQFPNQRAEVYVADGDAGNADWQPAGIWYLAGGNTCVYSNPKGELGATQHRIETSNRRFRDDEFLLPLDLTQGRSSIRIRIKFTPVNTPLFPGALPQELAWSEIRYDAWCFVTPRWNPRSN
ncbi:MAG TPA: DUF2961 domain-containing protein [Verrucomicrobiae bacterium]|nr:DUF2961 domain-containing protein [Verrucomicrobiae bacterium]